MADTTEKAPAVKKAPSGALGGRPRLDLDPDAVEELASHGLSLEEIARALGINPSTLQKKKRMLKQIEDAIERGRAKGLTIVANQLFDQCMKGNTRAIVFYLQTRAGWSPKQEIKAEVNATSTVNANVIIPEGMEQIYAKFMANDKETTGG